MINKHLLFLLLLGCLLTKNKQVVGVCSVTGCNPPSGTCPAPDVDGNLVCPYDGCKDADISGCNEVTCWNYACMDTIISEVGTLNCAAYAACYQANIEADTVICDDTTVHDSGYACNRATNIQANTLLCKGYLACYKTPIQANTVTCSSLCDGGERVGEYSCLRPCGDTVITGTGSSPKVLTCKGLLACDHATISGFDTVICEGHEDAEGYKYACTGDSFDPNSPYSMTIEANCLECRDEHACGQHCFFTQTGSSETVSCDTRDRTDFPVTNFPVYFGTCAAPDEDNDDVANDLDLCPGTTGGAVVDEHGCSSHQSTIELTASPFVFSIDESGAETNVDVSSGYNHGSVAMYYAWDCDGEPCSYTTGLPETEVVPIPDASGVHELCVAAVHEETVLAYTCQYVVVYDPEEELIVTGSPSWLFDLAAAPNTMVVTVDTEYDDYPNLAVTMKYAWDCGETCSYVDLPDTGQVPIPVMSGVYELCVAAVYEDGTVLAHSCQYVVVYDSEGGFVTGGGWIMSPEGAYVSHPTLTGKANFGFVSKYKKGATAPTGNTEFKFKAADLDFHSGAYDWLVIAGAKAQYKGVGTINGEGNYGFMLSAIDSDINGGGDSDKFRIKIWDKDTNDEIIYDNQVDGDDGDGADPTTVIGGGSIMIHKVGNRILRGAPSD